MKRDRRLYLQDIWDSILAIEEYTGDLTEDGFLSNRQAQDAVVRRLEIIGEAVKNLDAGYKDAHPQIPWKGIAGARDIIAHGYFGVRLERIWDIARKDIPRLKEQFAELMEEEEEE